MALRGNGRDPEVIVNFADGFSYSKGKLEEVFRSGALERDTTKVVKDLSLAKRENVDLIVHEFEIPRVQAEKLLIAHGGDVNEALRALITPPTVK
ncbi:hypothetical protein FIBSPDRAFT_956790 [Athelia psychrophila]|uniref:Nascent polypeptide-associated complex subunit alpha-like UBA domain-containing protein n=1 Tax=Athelia psychrophila TaxID=1759441 RepID=A0A166GHZ2_9AGAM|nr:hypothetical protein FIBSPDRAFT_956790 [Fibularhizoctonia sp. CBS 109695]